MKLFIKNKYTKIYFRLILRARNRNIKKYSENHHIIPKSCGGSNSKNNLVKLTAKEHFICHMILPKIMKNRSHIESMIYAAKGFMTGYHKKSKKKYNGKLYEEIKKQHSELQRRRWLGHKNPGKNKSPETIEKFRQVQLGKKYSEESKRKMSESSKKRTTGFMKGSRHSEESKSKISENSVGMLGKKHSEESRKKMSDAAKGKKMSKEARKKMSDAKKGKSKSNLKD